MSQPQFSCLVQRWFRFRLMANTEISIDQRKTKPLAHFVCIMTLTYTGRWRFWLFGLVSYTYSYEIGIEFVRRCTKSWELLKQSDPSIRFEPTACLYMKLIHEIETNRGRACIHSNAATAFTRATLWICSDFVALDIKIALDFRAFILQSWTLYIIKWTRATIKGHASFPGFTLSGRHVGVPGPRALDCV
jgi:hypothetical protein